MTGGKPLDDRYFEWLYSFIGSVRNHDPEISHWQLAKRLYTTEFIFFVPNDDNRALDGMDLREEFLDQSLTPNDDPLWSSLGCSVLEMLIALAKRADFHAFDGTLKGGVRGWFWKFMDNLRLSHYTDAVICEKDLEVIDEALAKFNNREYRPNGRGGLFPLRRPRSDQRDVELWYQLSAYLLENRYVKP